MLRCVVQHQVKRVTRSKSIVAMEENRLPLWMQYCLGLHMDPLNHDPLGTPESVSSSPYLQHPCTVNIVCWHRSKVLASFCVKLTGSSCECNGFPTQKHLQTNYILGTIGFFSHKDKTNQQEEQVSVTWKIHSKNSQHLAALEKR